MPCNIPYSRIFHAYEQSRCPGSDSIFVERGAGYRKADSEAAKISSLLDGSFIWGVFPKF